MNHIQIKVYKSLKPLNKALSLHKVDRFKLISLKGTLDPAYNTETSGLKPTEYGANWFRKGIDLRRDYDSV